MAEAGESTPSGDAPPRSAGGEPHHGIDRLELLAVIVLGVAAVLTAWSSFRASLVSDQVVANYSEMQALISQANDSYGNGDQQFAIEQQYFLTFALQANAAQDETGEAAAAYLLEAMGPELAAAVGWWIDEGADAGFSTPFVEENPEFASLPSSLAYEQGDALFDESEVAREAAEEADADSDRFEMANVFFAVTLFVAGIATLVRDRRITVGLLALGLAMMAAGVVIVVTTPGWASLS